MPTESPTTISKAVNPTDKIPAFRLAEMGSAGVNVFNGVSNEELKRELNHPYAIKTYKLMSYHPAINAPLQLYDSMIAKASFRIVPVRNATKKEKKQAELIQSMFEDMEHSLEDLIAEIMTMRIYGFAPVEKVFRYRTKANGSMFDDGLIGIRKLKLRNQETVEKFLFSTDGNDVTGLVQNLSGVSDPYGRYTAKTPSITLPRSKFMLFNLGRNRSNPYGTSALRDVYLPWKYLQAIEELEANAVQKDVAGLPVLTLPAQYMSADASPEQKAVYENFKNIGRNLQQGSQGCIVLPSAVDPETRTPLFKIELLSMEGKKSFDTTKIKEYYRTMIFIGLASDILLLGSTSVGSYSMGSLKNTLTGNAVEGILKRIVQVINEDLIKQLYTLNNWDASRRCKIDYEGFEDVDLDTYSRAVQRMSSTSMIPKTLDVINNSLKAIGVDPLPEGTTQEELDGLLGDSTSRAGEGYATAGEGLSTDPTNIDSNDNNLENN